MLEDLTSVQESRTFSVKKIDSNFWIWSLQHAGYTWSNQGYGCWWHLPRLL